jgi:hypothetical protein
LQLDETYRGYTIRLQRMAIWNAVLVDSSTGAVLPTKATALLREGRGVALERAISLVDLYCRGLEAGEQQAA